LLLLFVSIPDYACHNALSVDILEVTQNEFQLLDQILVVRFEALDYSFSQWMLACAFTKIQHLQEVWVSSGF
jgi:hypothetical protein